MGVHLYDYPAQVEYLHFLTLSDFGRAFAMGLLLIQFGH
jgi:hypothetical protein